MRNEIGVLQWREDGDEAFEQRGVVGRGGGKGEDGKLDYCDQYAVMYVCLLAENK